jgi:hypothetical protein
MVITANLKKVQEWVVKFRGLSIVLYMHELGVNQLQNALGIRVEVSKLNSRSINIYRIIDKSNKI